MPLQMFAEVTVRLGEIVLSEFTGEFTCRDGVSGVLHSSSVQNAKDKMLCNAEYLRASNTSQLLQECIYPWLVRRLDSAGGFSTHIRLKFRPWMRRSSYSDDRLYAFDANVIRGIVQPHYPDIGIRVVQEKPTVTGFDSDDDDSDDD